jgi:hypothetical protein
MYVSFETKCTQEFQKHYVYFEHIPNLICARQMCYKCEVVDELNVDCKLCGKRTHVFWVEVPVGKFNYLRQSRPFADKICHIT